MRGSIFSIYRAEVGLSQKEYSFPFVIRKRNWTRVPGSGSDDPMNGTLRSTWFPEMEAVEASACPLSSRQSIVSSPVSTSVLTCSVRFFCQVNGCVKREPSWCPASMETKPSRRMVATPMEAVVRFIVVRFPGLGMR